MAQPSEVPHGMMLGKLFRLKVSRPASKFRGSWGRDGPDMDEYLYEAGTLVKVTMVSRLGDCGATADVTAARGYDIRVRPEDLEPA